VPITQHTIIPRYNTRYTAHLCGLPFQVGRIASGDTVDPAACLYRTPPTNQRTVQTAFQMEANVLDTLC